MAHRYYYGARRTGAGVGGGVFLLLIVIAVLLGVFSGGGSERRARPADPPSPVYTSVPPKATAPQHEPLPERPAPAPWYQSMPSAAVAAFDASDVEPDARPMPAPVCPTQNPAPLSAKAKWVPASRRELEAAASHARGNLEQAREHATESVRRAEWHRRLAAQARSLEKRLEDVRLKGTAKEKLAASAAWNKVRVDLQRREAEALSTDAAVARGNADLQAALQQLAQFDKDEARRRAEREALAAAERQRAVAASEPDWGDDDYAGGSSYGGGSYSGGGDVRVRGYTRKDGTYVRPHTRSRPDGVKSNNRSSRGAGGRGRR